MELEELIDELALKMRLLQDMEEASWQPGDLTGREILLLELLHRHEELSISQLSSLCPGTAISTISMTITKLWRAKLVSKSRDPENQRITIVALTKEGREKLVKGKENRRRRNSAIVQALRLNDEEYKVFVSLLSRTVACFDEVLASSEDGRHESVT